jgi:hypothetical protein
MPTRHTHSFSFLNLKLVKLLLLESGWLAEVEHNGVGGQLSIGVGHGLKTGFNDLFVEWVKVDLLGTFAVGSNANGTAGDAAW